MKTAKLTIGILSIVLSLVVFFQSCAAGIGSALATAGTDTSGGTGMFVGILLIAAGIVAIAGRKSKKGAIAAAVLYALCGIVGLASASGIFKDLLAWGVVALIFAAVCIASVFVQKFEVEQAK